MKNSSAIPFPRIMGVLNVTPDSFYDGGKYHAVESAMAQVHQLVTEGADIIDIGGVSTRPNAQPISAQEECDRVLPVLEACRATFPKLSISVDTYTPRVMELASAYNIQLINDVRALQMPGALEAAAKTQLPVCLMHMQGTPETMQVAPKYKDVVREVYDFFVERINACVSAGIARERLILDPGFGFGKTAQHNLELLKNLSHFHELKLPVLVGLSRKSMIGHLFGTPVSERLPESLALAIFAYQQGASIIRTHDVAATRQALRMTECLLPVIPRSAATSESSF